MPFAKLIYQYPIIYFALFLELECNDLEEERACPADLQKVKGIKNQSSYMKNFRRVTVCFDTATYYYNSYGSF